ncbi:carboxypeptidase-like regulatory domain-containing protein [Ancylomarina euxinus]|uniref:Carboxypeptidase-like regulatory domain-containing protein n=1 Tax=Ancylomarina euxinus TaxID=2283627 RepID=A0A425Y068_9BACT|nr:DUF5686 and carboxypeptidase-like regulatory domain-containing protein [Ancylomarina euxinus]MCZ4695196.1 DUF5686 family protein [Ancylomarina euxinus]MUP15393.1 hypothetical protein [Ancylomarina euxinus]RRG21103.1 carboxypeptidase-like regulatory domain-containing protein [Ancylomarina euxinus]
MSKSTNTTNSSSCKLIYNAESSRLKYFFYKLLICVFVLISHSSIASTISGSIRDSKTKESIPFANVVIKNTTNGMMSDIEGSFILDVEKFPCTLVIKFIGYKTNEITVKNQEQILDILLEEDVYSLNEIIVKPDNAYERSLLRKVVKNRKRNNPDHLSNLSYTDYTRTTVFLSNLGIKTAQSGTFKESADAFVKTSESTLMMPFFMDETVSSHQRADKRKQSQVIAQKTDGILSQINTQVKSILEKKITTEFNFYNNQINILARGFPSPISNTGLLYYNIYLSDSTIYNNIKHYKFNYFPKSYKNITFKGHFWVESESWALTEIKASLPNSANLNFVKDLEVFVNYEKLNKDQWFYKTQKINLKLTLNKKEGKKRKKKNFDVQKLICYRNANTNTIQLLNTNSKSEYLIQNSIESSEEILAIRKEFAPLDSFERSAYTGIKKLKENKFIRVADKFSAMTINGYYNMGKLDLGPYFSFYRKNEIEGNRFTIPLRTSEKLFKNFMLGAYVGYGNKNKEFAYGGNMKYLLPNTQRSILSTNYHYDYFDLTKNKFIEFIRENPYQQGGGNIVSSFTSKIPNPYMMRNRHFDITYEHQLNKSFGLLIRPSLNRYYSNYNLIFNKRGDDLPYFDTQNLMLDLRLSFGQDYDEGYFSRIYYGNQKPVFHFTTLLGQYKLPIASGNKSGYYANLNVSMKNRVNMGPMFLKTMVEGGAILGNVPYPLLQLPRGTRDIGAARYHFNLLHHTSFASDLYMSAHLSLNCGGIIFNKLPLVKKLNLREIVTFKAYYGKLLGEHDKVLNMPNMLQAPNKAPYMEMGFGITNIFKCLRVEYVNRINRGDAFNKFSSKHGFRFRIEVSF